MESTYSNDAGPQIFWNSDFSKYLEASWKTGVDIDQRPLKYVTEDILSRYWTVKAVAQILNTGYHMPIAISADTIITQHLRVWSTLVFIGRPEFITWFHKKARNDEYFYASGLTEAAEQDSLLQMMLKAFKQEMHKFWPVRFRSPVMHKRELDSGRVLPIVSWRQLSQTYFMPRTVTYEVVLDPICCEYVNVSSYYAVCILSCSTFSPRKRSSSKSTPIEILKQVSCLRKKSTLLPC